METLSLGYLLAITAAGATLLGLSVIFLRQLSQRFIAILLLLVAGAMITVSLAQILPTSLRDGESWKIIIACFLAGVVAVLFLASIDVGSPSLRSLGLVVIALALHNFPEGMTTIGATLIDTDTGVTTAIIVALHNLPEGMAIATLARVAGLVRVATIALVLLATLAEILGASVIFFIGQEMSQETTSLILALVAGIMITISIKELIPYSLRILNDVDKR